MGGASGIYGGEKRSAYRVLVGKSDGERQHEKSRHRIILKCILKK